MMKKIVHVMIACSIAFLSIFLIKHLDENENNLKKYSHISIDDTILVFKDLTQNEKIYGSIFENDMLCFLKNCHDNYGAVFSLYCFYENEDYDLSKCTGKFREEFEENSEWLKFGFHALNSNVDYASLPSDKASQQYQKTLNELIRIVGKKSVTTVVRMEKFICNYNNIVAFHNCPYGISGLLGADSLNRDNYYLSLEQNNTLFQNDYFLDSSNDVFFYKTDIRIENIDNVQEEFPKFDDDFIIAFTHERLLNADNKIKIIKLCQLLNKNNYVFVFPYRK